LLRALFASSLKGMLCPLFASPLRGERIKVRGALCESLHFLNYLVVPTQGTAASEPPTKIDGALETAAP
jgi:hypothetical protein